MITRRTKIQLMIFVLITLLGVSFVGAKYAQLNRLVYNTTYTVVAHFQDSGGMYAGGMVAYRGVRVGEVQKLVLTSDGVDAYLDIDKGWDDKIPSDTLAVVGNRSAVGEQYVDLQPQTDSGPYLRDGSQIAVGNTRTPLPTQKLLGDISTTVQSVNRGSLRTTVHEFGQAFAGTGPDLHRIIDSGTSFIHAANANFDDTTALIKDSNKVLKGQVASAGAIRSFARDLRLFSGTLAGHDKDLRRVIDNGSVTATQLRRFLQDNRVHLASLINNLVTTGNIVVKHLAGLRQVLIIYPYVVEGGFTVVSKSPETGLYDAHFGMVMTNDPVVCHNGYQSTDTRPPQDGSNRPMNVHAHCAEPATQSSPRGSQHAPSNRPPAVYGARPASSSALTPVASYDPTTGRLTWGHHVAPRLADTGSLAPATLGEESWKWLLLQPLASSPR
jgi:phospholipid/cholesterol/gamma-HCH transport system substrate-binding protein